MFASILLSMMPLIQTGAGANPIAFILEVNGKVQLQPANGKERPARAQDLLRPGDRLVTEDKSHVLVWFTSSGLREKLLGKAQATVRMADCECDPVSARTQFPAPKKYPTPRNQKDKLGERGAGKAFVLKELDAQVEGFIPKCLALGAIKPQFHPDTDEVSFRVIDADKLKRAWPGLPPFSEELQEALFKHALLTKEEELAIYLLEKQAKTAKHAHAYAAFLYGKSAERNNDLPRALQEYNRAYASDDNQFWRATCISGIASVRASEGAYGEAERALFDSLNIFLRFPGAEAKLAVARNQEQLGSLYAAMGQFQKSETEHAKAMQIRKDLLGEEHPLTARSLRHLAFLYTLQEKLENAEALYLRAQVIYKESEGELHPDYVANLKDLACVYESQRKFTKAESLYEEVLQISMKKAALRTTSLEKGLLEEAPKILAHFKEQKHKNVGVLKFQISRDGLARSDDVGPLNVLAARRLETVLILANDPRDPVGITVNASDVAAKIAGASHLTPRGREKLFKGDYSLAWGKDAVQPDAFLTGTIDISKDLRTQTFTLFCVDRAAKKITRIGEPFHIVNTIDQLAEMGESFVSPQAPDDAQTEVAKLRNREKAFHDAVVLRYSSTKGSVQGDNQPVTLDVRYDGKSVPIEFKDGKAFVLEPSENQTVEFGLKHDKSRHRYGVVLKVNGENTLDKERVPDLSCKKWVLEEGKSIRVAGYYLGDKVSKFRIASEAESKQSEFNYGKDVGTITLTVFRAQKAKDEPKLNSDEEVDRMIVKNLAELPRMAKNLGALRARLSDEATRNVSRGLIVAGQAETSKVVTVPFDADPEPVMSLTIVYRKR